MTDIETELQIAREVATEQSEALRRFDLSAGMCVSQSVDFQKPSAALVAEHNGEVQTEKSSLPVAPAAT